jgi:FkbM family methyltransferase
MSYVCARLISFPRTFRVKGKGMSHPILLRAGTTDAAIFNSIFAGRQYALALSKTPRLVVDCGGYTGLAAVWFTNMYPDAKIVSVEPQSENYRMLVRNTAKYPNISTLHGAVWSFDTTLEVVDVGLGHCGFETRAFESSTETETTPAYSIETLMRQFSVETIDLLKLDIEGAEYELLDGNPRWLSDVNVLVVEFHDDKKPRARARFEQIASSHFSYSACYGEGKIFAKAAWVDPNGEKSLWSRLD